MFGADRALSHPHEPALDEREHPVDPREHLMSQPAGTGHRQRRVFIASAGRPRVCRPAIGDHVTARLDIGVQENGEADVACVGDDTESNATESTRVAFHSTGNQQLPCRSAASHPRFETTTNGLVDFNLATQSRPGRTMTTRYRWSIIHAVWIEPNSISRRTWIADTPILSPTIRHATANQTVSGVRVLSKIVPAVTDTLRSQPPHFQRESANRHPAMLAQCGQTNPSGQRSQSR
jgi:hypothetical protein